MDDRKDNEKMLSEAQELQSYGKSTLVSKET